jgi:signal transduction histidine kinase
MTQEAAPHDDGEDDPTPIVRFGKYGTLLDAVRAAETARLAAGQRLAILGSLAGGVVHDIVSPLSAVIGALDLIAADVTTLKTATGGSLDLDELERDTTEGRDAAERLLAVVRDARSLFLRPTADVESVVLHDELDVCVNLLRHRVRTRARIVTDYGQAVHVLGNAPRIRQVLLTLLLNAADAIAPGDPTRNEIRIGVRDRHDGRVRVDVQDTGCGIDRRALDRLFEPFYTTKPADTATGVGLYVARALARQMGGDIEVESTTGAGSTFVLLLPRAPAH